MPLSRFPRHEFRLAPASLREVLELPLPRAFRNKASSGTLNLCDLDEYAWQKFSPEACVCLGQVVVETVRRAINALPMNIQRRLIPAPPEGMTLEDLHLEQRTYNCLRRLLLEGRLAKVSDLGRKTIGDLLGIEGFGAKCLVDLLTSLEATRAPRREQESQPKHEDTGQQREEDGSLRLLFSRIRHLRLPKLPEGATLADLTLAGRTYNCLEKQGYLERPHALEELTVEQALEIPGFGMQSLMDYLAAIELHRHGGAPGEAGQSRKHDEFPPLAWTLSGEHSFLARVYHDDLVNTIIPTS
jgi:hypothetical protein